MRQSKKNNRKSTAERLREQSAQLEKQHLKDTAGILDAMKKRFGREVAGVVDDLVASRTRRAWREIARAEKSHTVDDIVRRIWAPWLRNTGYEFSIEKQDNGIMVRVTKCPTFKMAQELGEQEWANHLICQGDPAMVEGFNPKLGMKFIECMMEGGRRCEQFYYEKEAAACR